MTVNINPVPRTDVQSRLSVMDVDWRELTRAANAEFNAGRHIAAKDTYDLALSTSRRLLDLAAKGGPGVETAPPRFVVSTLNAVRNARAAGLQDLMQDLLASAADVFIDQLSAKQPMSGFGEACAVHLPVLMRGYLNEIREAGLDEARYQDQFERARENALKYLTKSSIMH